MIRVIHFPGLTALPLYVASAKGLFAEQDIEVLLNPTSNSRQLMVGLLDGAYEIGQAAIDNLIAYQEKQAAPELEVERDLIAFMETSSTNLDLVVQPNVQTYADLKGTTLAVDAPTTGFAFVLRKMLEDGGLTEDEYSLSAVGGDIARLNALKKKDVAGALLAKDFADQATASGLRRLAESSGVVGKCVGTSLFARRGWALSHRDDLVSFVRAIRGAHDYLFDPSHTAEAASILAAQMNGMSEARAAALVQQTTTDRGGLSRTGRFDSEGLKAVLSLRSQYGTPKYELSDPSRYVDLSYLASAER